MKIVACGFSWSERACFILHSGVMIYANQFFNGNTRISISFDMFDRVNSSEHNLLLDPVTALVDQLLPGNHADGGVVCDILERAAEGKDIGRSRIDKLSVS